MKTLILSSLMLLSINAFASNVVADVVQSVERAEQLSCTHKKTTMSLCYVYTCTNKEIFTCTDGRDSKTLTLRVKTVKIPNKPAKVTITSTNLQ